MLSKNRMCCTLTLLASLAVAQSVGTAWAGVIMPSRLQYQGAFRLPAGRFIGNTDPNSRETWDYSYGGLAFNPSGNGGVGSLFGFSNNQISWVGEVSIATPVISSTKTLSALHTATQLQNFYSVGSGLLGLACLPAEGLQTTPKLYATSNQGNNASAYFLYWSELTLSNLQLAGAWNAKTSAGLIDSRAVKSFISPIPQNWANAYTSGRSLLIGGGLEAFNGGPTIAAVGPWIDGNPPAANATINGTILLSYTTAHPMANYSNKDYWYGASWLTSVNDSAVVIFGTKDIGGGTMHAYALFYNQADLAAVAAGGTAYSPQPFATFDLESYMWGTTHTLRSATFDSTNGILYVTEPQSDSVKPLIHVFLVQPPGPDTTPPAAITNLAVSAVTSNTVKLTWTAPGNDGMYDLASGYDLRYSTSTIATDADFAAGTQVTGLPAPQAPYSAEAFTVTGLNSNTTYYFAIKTRDQVPNWSGLSNIVTASTPVPDLTPPTQITDLAVAGVKGTSVTLSWTTPTDTQSGVGGYDIRYSKSAISGDSDFTAATKVTNPPTPAAAGTAVQFTIKGLDPLATYYFAIKSYDQVVPANVSLMSNAVSAATTNEILPVVVHNPWLVNDRVADTHNINTMAATYVNAYTPDGVVTPTTNEQKAINVYNNQKRRLYHWGTEPPLVGGYNITDPTYNQNVFGWCLCGRHAAQGMTISRYAGFSDTRIIQISAAPAGAHNIYEVYYDNAWHLLDTMCTMYVFTKGATPHIASLVEISGDHTLMTSAVADKRACPGFLLCGDDPVWYTTAIDHGFDLSHTLSPVAWTGKMDLRLGQFFKRTWEAWLNQHPTPTQDADHDGKLDPPYHHEGGNDWKDTVNIPYWEPYNLTAAQYAAINVPGMCYRRWANGTDTLAPDFRSAAYQSMLESTSHDIATNYDDNLSPDLHCKAVGATAEAIFKISVPYYITDASFSGDFLKTNSGDTCSVFISTDGSSWTSVWTASSTGTTHVANQPLRTNVFGLWQTWYIKVQLKGSVAKTDAGVNNFVVTTTFEHNKGAMAYLDKGVNHITLTFDNASELLASRNLIHVYYKWKEYDGTDWTIDQHFEGYYAASPSTFTITTGGTKVPRTEYVLMEVIPPPYDVTPPARITTLAAGIASASVVPLTWTATGDDGATGQAIAYSLRYSTAPITDDVSFAAATAVANVPAPKAAGAAESFTVTGLAGSTTYYFAIKAIDKGNNYSLLSNVVSATTTPPDVTPPDSVSDLAGKTSVSSGAVDLTWTSPADWGPSHSGPYTCAGYDLRYSTATITDDATFSAAAAVTGVPAPKAPGSAEAFTVTGLTGGTRYYFAMKSRDDSNNVSALSNSANAKASIIGERTLQVGLNSYTGEIDSYIYVGAPTTNYGTFERMVVSGYGSAGYQRGLVKFDLSSLPAGATITSATLFLYSYYPSQTKGSSGAYGLYPLTRPFIENGVTWNTCDGTTAWTTPGGDFLATPDATAAKQAPAGAPYWYQWDVTARVQSWLNGAGTNNGWIIKCTDESLSDQDWFYQMDTANASLRPKLVISDIVAAADTTPPTAVKNLAGMGVSTTAISLTWTATGDDGSVGTATSYNLRYSTSPITDMATFNAATAVSGLPAPKAAGLAESLTISGLTAGTTYYFALVVTDEAGNASGLSNVATVATLAPRKLGDINYDGYVNIGDLQLLVAAWGSDNSGAWANWNSNADLNGDSYINVNDLQILVANWGT